MTPTPVILALGLACWPIPGAPRECQRIEAPASTMAECRARRAELADRLTKAGVDYYLFGCARVYRDGRAQRREGQ